MVHQEAMVAAVRRHVGLAVLGRMHRLIRAEAEERRRIWIFTRHAGIAALLVLLLLVLAVFGARL